MQDFVAFEDSGEGASMVSEGLISPVCLICSRWVISSRECNITASLVIRVRTRRRSSAKITNNYTFPQIYLVDLIVSE